MIKNVEKAINDLGIVCDPVDCVSIHDVVKIVKYLDKNGLITYQTPFRSCREGY